MLTVVYFCLVVVLVNERAVAHNVVVFSDLFLVSLLRLVSVSCMVGMDMLVPY